MGAQKRAAGLAEVDANTKQMLLDVIDRSPHGPAHVVDLGDIHRKLDTWVAALPRVKPFYAVKCNNDPYVLSTLASLGTGFDCATEAEFRSMIARGVSPKNIVYAHPCKQRTQLQAARALGVEMMTFDNEDELAKVAEFYPEAKLILRIMADDSQSVCKFNSKFAAAKAEHPRLLDRADKLGLKVVGISFHVGSGCESAAPFADAVSRAKEAWSLAETFGFKMEVLDLGGGFPGDSNCPVSFQDIAKVLGPAIDEHFPAAEFPPSRLRIIAEPGRYFVASCSTLATRVIAKRSIAADGTPTGSKSVMYYVNDGVYGAFNCVLYDHQVVFANILQAKTAGEPLQTTVWGPSCDSMDLIKKDFVLDEVGEGDWLYWKNMGAYTFCAQSTFNGFSNSTPFYTYSKVGNGAAAVGEAEQPPFLLNLTPTAEADFVWKARPEY